MQRKRKHKLPIELIAARKGNRDGEFEVFGPGFHCKDRAVSSRKKYNRKKQPKINIEEDDKLD